MSLLSFVTALTSTPETSPRLDPNPRAYGVMAALLDFATHIPRFRKAFWEGGRVDDRGRCCLYEIVIPGISWNRARMSEYIRFD